MHIDAMRHRSCTRCCAIKQVCAVVSSQHNEASWLADLCWFMLALWLFSMPGKLLCWTKITSSRLVKQSEDVSVQAVLSMQAAKEKLCRQRRIVSSIFDQVKHEQLKISMRQKRIRHLLSAEDGVQQQLQLSSKPLTCGRTLPVLSTELTIPGMDSALLGTVLTAPRIRSADPGIRLVRQQPSALSKRSCAPFPPGVLHVLACSNASSAAQHKQTECTTCTNMFMRMCMASYASSGSDL